jgi:hypothetical protein
MGVLTDAIPTITVGNCADTVAGIAGDAGWFKVPSDTAKAMHHRVIEAAGFAG